MKHLLNFLCLESPVDFPYICIFFPHHNTLRWFFANERHVGLSCTWNVCLLYSETNCRPNVVKWTTALYPHDCKECFCQWNGSWKLLLWNYDPLSKVVLFRSRVLLCELSCTALYPSSECGAALLNVLRKPVIYSFWRRGLQYLHGMQLWRCLLYGVLLTCIVAYVWSDGT